MPSTEPTRVLIMLFSVIVLRMRANTRAKQTVATLGSSAPSGTYTIKVRYYSTHGVTQDVQVNVKLTLGGMPILYGPYTFTASQANQDDPSNDILVDTFTMA